MSGSSFMNYYYLILLPSPFMFCLFVALRSSCVFAGAHCCFRLMSKWVSEHCLRKPDNENKYNLSIFLIEKVNNKRRHQNVFLQWMFDFSAASERMYMSLSARTQRRLQFLDYIDQGVDKTIVDVVNITTYGLRPESIFAQNHSSLPLLT